MDSEIISDSLKVVAQEATSKSSDTSWLMHHILDGRELEFPPFGVIHLPELHLFGLDISITKHVIFMWIAVALLVVIFKLVSNGYKKSIIPKGLTNLVEVLVVFVRDEIARPTIGKGFEKFLPYLLTVFFFILTCNFLGLLPYGATATSNIAVTATLAVISFLFIQVGGMMQNGVFGYFKGLLPHGLPAWLLPIMLVVELLGLFTKPFALAIRLFANMTAGHIVILALLGLIFILQTYVVVPVSVAFALFIYLLEILVSLIQAYIFTMLSSLFIGMAVHQEH
ncbi:MAG: F0F1 ATP synthase subunit A [Melioribacteraceae bacterium]|nr:F0F1 ATP synthase subunit A [Melioribacteraceae bacterium]MCF8264640.1 F0F1 ATP synthase subunit A [Melioribacteraceae bacterium]MCF8411986.1 F0F1 ATP synthase subunit A [Melioribacteraceae bacterium]